MASHITLMSRVRFEQLATLVLGTPPDLPSPTQMAGHSGAAIPTPASRVMRPFMSNAVLGGIRFVLSGLPANPGSAQMGGGFIGAYAFYFLEP